MENRPKLLEQVRQTARLRHLSRKTENAYAAYIKRFILFHGKRHPREMGADEIRAFLTDMAVRKKVAAFTQNENPRTTQIYTHVAENKFFVRSPMDERAAVDRN